MAGGRGLVCVSKSMWRLRTVIAKAWGVSQVLQLRLDYSLARTGVLDPAKSGCDTALSLAGLDTQVGVTT